MNTQARPKVLFVCLGNACRSQMAEAFTKKIAPDKFDVYSAGEQPARFVDPSTILVMKEKNIDISQAKTKGFSELPELAFDYVIVMDRRVLCPFYPTKEKLYWKIDDPRGMSVDVFRKARNKIESEVKQFIKKEGGEQ